MSRLPPLFAAMLALGTPAASFAGDPPEPVEKMSASRQRYDARNDALRQLNNERRDLSRALSEGLKRGKAPTKEARAQLESLRQIIEHLEEEQIEETKKFQAAESAKPEAADEPAEDALADPSDVYFQAWLLSRDAEKLKTEGKLERSRENLEKALELFSYVAKEHPAWKPQMVQGRLMKTKSDLSSLSPEAR